MLKKMLADRALDNVHVLEFEICVVEWYLVSVRISGCHVWPHSFLCLQITRSDIRSEVKWAVNMIIADSHFNLPQGFVCICTNKQTNKQKFKAFWKLKLIYIQAQTYFHGLFICSINHDFFPNYSKLSSQYERNLFLVVITSLNMKCLCGVW